MSLLFSLAVRLQAESGPAVTLVDEDRNGMLHDRKTLAHTVRAMRPIVPARDFNISERFYVDHTLMVLLRFAHNRTDGRGVSACDQPPSKITFSPQDLR